MLGSRGEILYVGKARNLYKRLASYFRPAAQLPIKTRAMMARMKNIEVSVTYTEGEALLLESNLIKEYSPKYNIVLRDDKSYPYIYLSSHQDFPRLSLHRGARKGKGHYFGPYPSAAAVRDSLNLMQKLFQIRQCEDSFLRNRSRPCLQYQIKRCTAPCVDLVNPQCYREDVRHAVMFLKGKSSDVINELAKQMEDSSRRLEFERAARYRDQISSLRKIQERQYVTTKDGDLDVVTVACADEVGCVQVCFIRGGRNLGNKTFFPRNTRDMVESTILRGFLLQFYLVNRDTHRTPAEIIVSHDIEDRGTLAKMLCGQEEKRVRIINRVRGERSRWLQMAGENTRLALRVRLADTDNVNARLEGLQSLLHLDSLPQRIECFDVSHTSGESTVASCVVFGNIGPLKSEYRHFNIERIQPGDDYGAMRQALERRYTRIRREGNKLPDILLIDGGKGQVKKAVQVLEELQIQEVSVVGVAKGPSRKPGLEVLVLPGKSAPLILPHDSAVLHYIQRIRDEAHRFAITAHRKRRALTRSTSILEELPGIGPKRRRRLLKQFGGLQGVASAGVEDLASIEGISSQLASRIYEAFHTE